MASYKERVWKLIGESRDYVAIAAKIYGGEKALALYVMQVGVETLAAKRRRSDRQELRSTVVKDDFVKRPGGPAYSVKPSRRSMDRLGKVVADFFHRWKIGALDLGDATREDLLAEANKERASSKGHLRNAVFYEKLAEPMEPGQRTRDYWKSAEAVKLIRDELWRDTEGKGVGFED